MGCSWSSTPLDVMRVDTGDGSHRMSVCYATYGYMGDLLYISEGMRRGHVLCQHDYVWSLLSHQAH